MQTAVGLSTKSDRQREEGERETDSSRVSVSSPCQLIPPPRPPSATPRSTVFPCHRLVHHCQELMLRCSDFAQSPAPAHIMWVYEQQQQQRVPEQGGRVLGSCTTIRVQICFNSILPTRDATRKRRHEVMPGSRRRRAGTVVNIGKVIETEMRLRRLPSETGGVKTVWGRGSVWLCFFFLFLGFVRLVWNLIKLIKSTLKRALS